MIASPIPQAAYTVVVSPTKRREFEAIYFDAVLALDRHKMFDWLSYQHTTKIIAEPRSALSCLLATYLLAKTKHLWCVSQERFWRFDLAIEFSWLLPNWAIALEQAELQMDGPLTAADGLYLMRVSNDPSWSLSLNSVAQVMPKGGA